MSHTLLAGTDTAAGLWTAGLGRVRMGYGVREAGRWGFRPSDDRRTATRAVTSRRAGRMRRTRIEKPRRPARTRRYADETSGVADSLDPRDPDIVRAKRLRARPAGGDGAGAP
ncbi:hypothetical protein GCM10010415_53140 [Streptomyces atrovirens]